MMLLRSCRGWVLCGLLGLAGCAAHPPVPLYQLDAGNSAAPVARNGMVVLLGPLTLAEYLQREVLLQRQLDDSLAVTGEAQWAGSLAEDIDQLLLRQLAWRLQTPNILLAPASPGQSSDVQVQVHISRLDSGPERPAVLHAQWRVLDKAGQLRANRMVQLEQAHAGSLASQVQAQSQLLQQLAAQLAAAVTALNATPVDNPPNKPAAANRKPATAPAKIPQVEPAAGTAEVFSF